jgi:hypothetical protein
LANYTSSFWKRTLVRLIHSRSDHSNYCCSSP